MEVQRSIFGQI